MPIQNVKKSNLFMINHKQLLKPCTANQEQFYKINFIRNYNNTYSYFLGQGWENRRRGKGEKKSFWTLSIENLAIRKRFIQKS